jgi:hypothetical protein
MRQISFLLLLIIVLSCNNSVGVKSPLSQKADSNSGFHPFLAEGTYKAEYHTNKEINEGQKKLLQKLSELIQSNKQAQKYFRLIEEGEKPAFNPDMGINKKEFNQLIELFSESEPEMMNGLLMVSREGNIFTFEGKGKLSLFNSLVLKVNEPSASYKQYNLGLVKDSIDLTSEDIPKDCTIGLYEYYKGPEGILGLTGLEGSVELLIAKLKPGNKIYLSIIVRHLDSIEHPFPEFINVLIYR